MEQAKVWTFEITCGRRKVVYGIRAETETEARLRLMIDYLDNSRLMKIELVEKLEAPVPVVEDGEGRG